MTFSMKPSDTAMCSITREDTEITPETSVTLTKTAGQDTPTHSAEITSDELAERVTPGMPTHPAEITSDTLTPTVTHGISKHLAEVRPDKLTETVTSATLTHPAESTSETLTQADEERAKQGIHELEISFGGELDLHRHFNSCSKNPGHKEFIRVNKLTMKCLPESHRSGGMLLWIKHKAMLTVKLSVNYVSPNRPKQYPLSDNTEQERKCYPLSDCAGQKILSVGSGCVTHITLTDNKDTLICPFKDCPELPGQHQVYGYITITTAAHVVFDDLEAENTIVEFFYDSSEDRSGVQAARGVKVGAVSVEGDFCELLCVTHDRDLFDIIDHLLSGCEVCPVLYDYLQNQRLAISSVFQKVPGLVQILLPEPFSNKGNLEIKVRDCGDPETTDTMTRVCKQMMPTIVGTMLDCSHITLTTKNINIEKVNQGCVIVRAGSHKIKLGLVKSAALSGNDSQCHRPTGLQSVYTIIASLHAAKKRKIQAENTDPVSAGHVEQFQVMDDDIHHNLDQFQDVDLQDSLDEFQENKDDIPPVLHSLSEIFARNDLQLVQPNNFRKVLTQISDILDKCTDQPEVVNGFTAFLKTTDEFLNAVGEYFHYQATRKKILSDICFSVRMGRFMARVICKLTELNDFRGLLNKMVDVLNVVDTFITKCFDYIDPRSVINGFIDTMCTFYNTNFHNDAQYDHCEFLHIICETLNKMDEILNRIDEQITEQFSWKQFFYSSGFHLAMQWKKLKNMSKSLSMLCDLLKTMTQIRITQDDQLLQLKVAIGFVDGISHLLKWKFFGDVSGNDFCKDFSLILEFFSTVKLLKKNDDDVTKQDKSSVIMKRMGASISELVCLRVQELSSRNFIKCQLKNKIRGHYVGTTECDLNTVMDTLSLFVDKTNEFVSELDDHLIKHNFVSGFMNKMSEFLDKTLYRSKYQDDYKKMLTTVEVFVKKITLFISVIDDQQERKNVFNTFMHSMSILIMKIFYEVQQLTKIKQHLNLLNSCMQATETFVCKYNDPFITQNIFHGFVNYVDLYLKKWLDLCTHDNDYDDLTKFTEEFITEVYGALSRIIVQLKQQNFHQKFTYKMGYHVARLNLSFMEKMPSTEFVNNLVISLQKMDDFLRRFDDQNIIKGFVVGFVFTHIESLHSWNPVQTELDSLFVEISKVLSKMSELVSKTDDHLIHHILLRLSLQTMGNAIVKTAVYQIEKLMNRSYSNQENINEYTSDCCSKMSIVACVVEKMNEFMEKFNHQIPLQCVSHGLSNNMAETINTDDICSVLMSSKDSVLREMDYLNKFYFFFIKIDQGLRKLEDISKRLQKQVREYIEIFAENFELLKMSRQLNQLRAQQDKHHYRFRALSHQRQMFYLLRREIARFDQKHSFSQPHSQASCNYLAVHKVNITFIKKKSVCIFQDDVCRLWQVEYSVRQNYTDYKFFYLRENDGDKLVKENAAELLVHISHPHGQSKQVTFGQQVDCFTGHGYYKQMYTASTCPGSSGGPVWMLPGNSDQAYSMPHSGCHGNQLNHGCAWTLYMEQNKHIPSCKWKEIVASVFGSDKNPSTSGAGSDKNPSTSDAGLTQKAE